MPHALLSLATYFVHRFSGMDVNSGSVSGVTNGKQKSCETVNANCYDVVSLYACLTVS
jgi:hypothetical protein